MAQQIQTETATLSTPNICLNSLDGVRTNGEIRRPISIMMAGVFNDYLKTPEALKNSARWWNVPIVIYSQDSDKDHPESVIVTNNTVKVGLIQNAVWDEASQKIKGDAVIYEELCPDWLLTQISTNQVKGVSGTYFCDLSNEQGEVNGKPYVKRESNYAPNNVAIVQHPACTPEQGCGLNVNSQAKAIEEPKTCATTDESEIEDKNGNKCKASEMKEGLCPVDIEIEEINDVPITNNTKGEIEMAEVKIEDIQADLEKANLEINSMKETAVAKEAVLAEKDAKILAVEAELNAAKTIITGYETAKKEAAFIAQFPEASREAAKTELLALFMEDPKALVMNHAKRLGELLVPAGVPAVSVGAEHVSLDLVETPQENEDDAVLGMLPSNEDAIKMMRGKK